MRTLLLVALTLVGCAGEKKTTETQQKPPSRPEAPSTKPATADWRTEVTGDLPQRLASTITMLAQTIGERNLGNRPDALATAATWVAAQLAKLGEVKKHSYEVDGKTATNIELVLPGSSTGSGVIVIGAHYDSALGTPGADDNASGVAALLELARLLAPKPRAKELRFVAFVNEEPPYFHKDTMGSLVYAKALKNNGVEVGAMVSLESIGYFSDEPGSQNYPPPMSLLYPDVGNFVGMVGNPASADLTNRFHAAFTQTTSFPAERGIVPGNLPGVSWSDHWSFWQTGVPAIMVTNTAPFRNPHYHKPTDTPECVDTKRLAHVTLGLEGAITALAE